MKIKKALVPLVFFTLTAILPPSLYASEYQWKFTIDSLDNSPKAVQVFQTLHDIPGVYDVAVNTDRESVMFFYDDEKTDEEAIKKVLNKAGHKVVKMMLLLEPKGGPMN